MAKYSVRVSRLSLDLTSKAKRSFLKDPAKYMKGFLRRRGLKVNGVGIILGPHARNMRACFAAGDDGPLQAHIETGALASNYIIV